MNEFLKIKYVMFISLKKKKWNGGAPGWLPV